MTVVLPSLLKAAMGLFDGAPGFPSAGDAVMR